MLVLCLLWGPSGGSKGKLMTETEFWQKVFIATIRRPSMTPERAIEIADAGLIAYQVLAKRLLP